MNEQVGHSTLAGAPFLRRHAMRAAVGKHWRLRLTGPNGADVWCQVTDCSVGGIAVRAEAKTLEGLDALFLGQADVEIDQRRLCSVLLSLRHRTKSHDGQDVAGLQLSFACARDRAVYIKAVRQALFPQVHLGAELSCEVWHILSKAGSLDLDGRHPQHVQQQKNDFFAVCRRLGANPGLAQQFVWRDEDGAKATLAVVKPFAATQLLHHLGRVPDAAHGQRSMRELFVCCLELSRTEIQTRCLAAYLTDDGVFDTRRAIQFAKERQNSGHAQALAAHIYEVNSLCDARLSLDLTLNMRQMRQGDRAMIAAAAERLRGGLYAQAFDLTPELLEGEKSCQTWSQAGLQRERCVMLVGCANQQPLLAVVLDRAAAGADLLGTLDAMTLIPLHQDAKSPQMQSACELGLAFAKNWFLLRGAGQFFFADFDASFGRLGPPGATSRGPGAVWLVHKPLFGALQTYWTDAPTPSPQGAFLQ